MREPRSRRRPSKRRDKRTRWSRERRPPKKQLLEMLRKRLRRHFNSPRTWKNNKLLRPSKQELKLPLRKLMTRKRNSKTT